MVKKDRWGREVAEGGEIVKDAEPNDTTVNVNVDADKPADTVVEKRTEKKVVVQEDDRSDDTPTPSTES